MMLNYMIPIIISFALIIPSGLFYSGMWIMYFYYDQSIFSRWANQDFWNPGVPNYSHLNKYKNRNKADGPAFFGSTTFLVLVTDGFHLLQECFKTCYELAISIMILFAYSTYKNITYSALSWVLLAIAGTLITKFIFGIGFNLGLERIFKLRSRRNVL
jgi:hypothetical protein